MRLFHNEYFCGKVRLVQIQGPLRDGVLEFESPKVTVGRHPSCDLRFPANLPGVSRKHAEITREGDRFRLNDYSTGGTFLNGQKVVHAYLEDGDTLTFGAGGPAFSFRLRKVAEPPPNGKGAAASAEPPVPLREEADSPDIIELKPDMILSDVEETEEAGLEDLFEEDIPEKE
jgi:pSer/pThr/pTyr-binding forkhead associated (FHA) protein